MAMNHEFKVNDALFKQLYNAFDPTRPLEVDSPVYVDCQAVRGNVNSVENLSKNIRWAQTSPSCQLYTGHRGSGKSTELRRLVAELEGKGYRVIYFDVLEDGIDPEDARYADILIACTRHLLKNLQTGDDRSIKEWIKDRLEELRGLAGMAAAMADLTSGDFALGVFAKLIDQLRAVPNQRQQIRQRLEPHTISLLKVLNEFIDSAQTKLPEPKPLVLIADGLDRIVPIVLEYGRQNHDEIFVDRSDQLRGLKCHVVYTVPISMVYYGVQNHLKDRYDDLVVLPMVKVKERGQSRVPYAPGVQTFKELLTKRLQKVAPTLTLSTMFENEALVDQLCLSSGGNARELMHLMRDTLKRAPIRLPILAATVTQVIAESRESYRRMTLANHWPLLAEVYIQQAMPNLPEYRGLLYDRCILEYREEADASAWHDVHPLLVETREFQAALAAHHTSKSQIPRSS